MSEEIRKKNYDVLQKKFPGICERIEEKKEKLLKEEHIYSAWEESFQKEKILKIKLQQGRQLYLAGKRDPAAHARNQVSVLGKIVPYAPVFIVGMGNTHYVQEVIKNTDPTVEILLYEPVFSIFNEIIKEIDISNIFKDRLIALVVNGINDDGLESIVRTMMKGDKVPLLKHFVLPNYEAICLLKIQEFYKMVLPIAEKYRLNVNTNLYFTTVMAENLYHNVKYFKVGYSANQLSGKIDTTVPAIVVSAGPSLNINIKELKRAKNKAFIIAVDTAIKPLLKENIIPDMFATIDPNKSIELIKMEKTKKIPMIASIIGTRKIFDYHQGKKFFVNRGWTYIRKLLDLTGKEYAGLSYGGSVATLAFSLVCHLGFKTIVLVGQDLAFTGNKMFADGTHKEKMDTIDTSKFIVVPGNCEDSVPTNALFKDFIDWFETFIQDWKESYDVRFINATEGGAKIKGTEVMALKDVIDQECKKEVDFDHVFEALQPFFDEKEQQIIEQYFKDTPKRIHQIVQLANEGGKIYKKLDMVCNNPNLDKKAFLKILKRIKRNRKEIEKNENYEMLSGTMTKAEQIILTSQYFYSQNMQEEGKELARQGKIFMELLKGYAEILEKVAEEEFLNCNSQNAIEVGKNEK